MCKSHFYSSTLKVRSLVKSYQRLKKWYLIPPCLTPSNIMYISRVKWRNPGKGVVPFPTPLCSSYWKWSLLVTLDYGRQLYYPFPDSDIFVTNDTQAKQHFCSLVVIQYKLFSYLLHIDQIQCWCIKKVLGGPIAHFLQICCRIPVICTALWRNGQSVYQWSWRLGFNPMSSHTKDSKNGTWYLLA